MAAWLPGTEGAGITDVLFGDYGFAGKLPVSWPSAVSQEPINSGDGKTPLFRLAHDSTVRLAHSRMAHTWGGGCPRFFMPQNLLLLPFLSTKAAKSVAQEWCSAQHFESGSRGLR